MEHQAIEHFLVTVRRNTGRNTNNVSVQKIAGNAADIKRLASGQAIEFEIDNDKATQIARASSAMAPRPAAPSASAASAWRSMPGGWATLAAAGGAAAIAAHGVYPLHDGVARVAAGKIISSGPSTSYASMPGGWASLANTAGVSPAAVQRQPAPSNGLVAPPAPVAAAAPVAPVAPVAAAAPAAAQNDNSAGASAWAAMPGGWATLAASGGAAATAAHGAYALHDGVARVAAGKIIPPSAGPSYAAMPGGWATLNR